MTGWLDMPSGFFDAQKMTESRHLLRCSIPVNVV